MTRVTVTARVQRTGQQALRVLRLDDPLGVGNRIAVRVDLGTPEHLVHPIDQPLRHDVLELLGLVVDFVPAVPHDLHEEQLDEAVPPEDQRGELLRRRASG